MATSSRSEDETIQIGDTIIDAHGTRYKILKLSEPKIKDGYTIYDKTEIEVTTPSGEVITSDNLKIMLGLISRTSVHSYMVRLFIHPTFDINYSLQKIATTSKSTTFGKIGAFMGISSSEYIKKGDELVDRKDNKIKILELPKAITTTDGGYTVRTYNNIKIKITTPSGDEFIDDKLYNLIHKSANSSRVEHILKLSPKINMFYYDGTWPDHFDVSNSNNGSRIYRFSKLDEDAMVPSNSSTSSSTVVNPLAGSNSSAASAPAPAEPTSVVNPLAAASNSSAASASAPASIAKFENPLAASSFTSVKNTASLSTIENPLAGLNSSAAAAITNVGDEEGRVTFNPLRVRKGGSRKNRRKSRRNKSKKRSGRGRKTLKKSLRKTLKKSLKKSLRKTH